ncbi:MAG: hypothetical protein ACRC0Y_12575, partial [Fusobacteriaceae bacterium]
MKKFLKIIALVAVFNMAIKNVEAAKIFSAKSAITGKELKVSNSSIIGEGIEIDYTLKKDMVVLKIKNKSDQLLTIDWNIAKYIGLDGKEFRAYDFKQKDRGWFESLTPAGIRPGDSYEGYVVPSSNLGSISGKGVTGGVIYINKYLFEKNSKEMEMKKRDYAELVIPIMAGNPHSGVSEDIIIYLVEDETAKIVIVEEKSLKSEKKLEVVNKSEIKNETEVEL